jgi:hypothetical protein
VALVLVGSALAWSISAAALSAHWLAGDPSRALAVSDDALALAGAAQDEVGGSSGEGRSLDAAERMAERSLARQPLNPAALRVMAEVAMSRGDQPRAMALFAAAERWSRRDVVTEAMLLDDALRRGDAAGAARRADVVLRFSPGSATGVFPALKGMVEHGPGQPAVVASLATRPPWRSSFLNYLSLTTTQPPVALDVLSRLADAGSPPSADEVTPLLNRLVADHRYLDAFIAWRQFLPPGSTLMTGNIRDPSFGIPSGTPPFSWALQSGPGAAAEILQGPTPASGREHALRVTYDGVSATEPARQLLVLSPGTYRLTVEAYVASPLPAARLTWNLTCAGGGPALGATADTALDPGWTTLSADLTVPASGCEGQWLALKATPGENTADIEVWYDALRVRRE